MVNIIVFSICITSLPPRLQFDRQLAGEPARPKDPRKQKRTANEVPAGAFTAVVFNLTVMFTRGSYMAIAATRRQLCMAPSGQGANAHPLALACSTTTTSTTTNIHPSPACTRSNQPYATSPLVSFQPTTRAGKEKERQSDILKKVLHGSGEGEAARGSSAPSGSVAFAPGTSRGGDRSGSSGGHGGHGGGDRRGPKGGKGRGGDRGGKPHHGGGGKSGGKDMRKGGKGR